MSLKVVKNLVFIFMIGLFLQRIDPMTSSPLQIGENREEPTNPASVIDETSFNSLDYSSASDYIGQISAFGKKGKGKSVAIDRVNPAQKEPDCGTGLKIVKDTQYDTFVSVRNSDSDVDEDEVWNENEAVVDSSSLSFTRIKSGNQSIVPWQVYIREKGSATPICGGSILNPTWILTAQHCELTVSDYEVFFGATAPSQNHLGYQIKTVINREGYKQKDHDNDFTLLELAKPIKFSSSIHPICLPQPNQNFDRMDAIASGWGHTKSPRGPFPNKLLSANMFIRPDSGCNKHFKQINAYPLTDNQLCAYTTKESELCQGDSGGPLVVKTTKDRYMLVGIVSAAYKSCDRPIIFGEVANEEINGWIISHAFKSWTKS